MDLSWLWIGDSVAVDMNHILYVETVYRPNTKTVAGVYAVMDASRFDHEAGEWDNAPFVPVEERDNFLAAWKSYRSRKETLVA